VNRGVDDSNTNYVQSFLKACSLYESRMSDHITIHIDQLGQLISLSITTPSIPYCTHQSYSTSNDYSQFNTTITVQQTLLGPSPQTQAYIEKMEQEKMEKAKGQQADNRSFFSKYWMYIVPMVIFMVMMQNVDPNAAGGQSGGR